MNGLRKKTQTRMLNKIFKQEIGITEKSQEKRDCCGDNVSHKFYFD